MANNLAAKQRIVSCPQAQDNQRSVAATFAWLQALPGHFHRTVTTPHLLRKS
jgi:hypothetical protein